MAAGYGQQARAAQPVHRVALGAVVQGKPGLGQCPRDVAGERGEWIMGGQRPTVGIGQPGSRLGKFLSLGNRLEWPEIRWFQAEIIFVRVAPAKIADTVFRHGTPP